MKPTARESGSQRTALTSFISLATGRPLASMRQKRTIFGRTAVW